VVGIVQAAVSAAHRAEVPNPEQQPLFMHVFPAQQGLPAMPQGRQVLVEGSQTAPAPVHWEPGQQGAPASPHRWQTLLEMVVVEHTVLVSVQVPMVLVELVGQHDWPALPHVHDLAAQVP
jgi:hypothetical protein